MTALTSYVALLRAVNVGGTGKLPMATLKRLCDEAGFVDARTYIASGNVVFGSALAEARVKAELEARLLEATGKPVGVVVRTAPALAAALAGNPFGGRPGNRVVVVFLDDSPPPDALERVAGRVDEELALGRREIYISYSDGMASSKLRIPAAKAGTARNINTVTALVALVGSSSSE